MVLKYEGMSVQDRIEQRKRDAEMDRLLKPRGLPSDLQAPRALFGRARETTLGERLRGSRAARYEKDERDRIAGLQRDQLNREGGLAEAAMRERSATGRARMQIGAESERQKKAGEQGLAGIAMRGEEERKGIGLRQDYAQKEAQAARDLEREQSARGIGMRMWEAGVPGSEVENIMRSGPYGISVAGVDRPQPAEKTAQPQFVKPQFDKKGRLLPGTGVWATPPTGNQPVIGDERKMIDVIMGEDFDPKNPTAAQREYLMMLERTGRGGVIDDYMERYGY